MHYTELARYVAAHPDDFEQRWRLAKHLYMACAYREALGHLRELQRGRQDHLNVSRYLAATYYRLGMYDEAEDELRDALARRPDEIPLQRQLARVLERAGRREEAAMVWQRILVQDPDIPGGRDTLERLLSPESELDEARPGGPDSGGAISLKPGTVCPGCGAYNDDTNAACWQCGGSLQQDDGATPLPEVSSRGAAAATAPPWLRTVISVLATACLLALSVHLTLATYATARDEVMVFSRMPTVQQFVHRELLIPRLFTGLALLLGWPAALWIAARTLGRGRMTGGNAFLIGVLLAAGSYVLFWAPLHLMPFGLLLPGFGSLFVIIMASTLTFAQAVRVWVIQGVIVTGLAAGAFAAFQGVYPFSEFPAALKYSSEDDAERAEARASIDRLPVRIPVTFESSGSTWLDALCSTTGFEVDADRSPAPVLVELHHGDKTVYRDTVSAFPYRFTYPVDARAAYTLAISGAEATPTRVRVRSALRPLISR